MSCELTSGITQGCKDVTGGIKYFWLTNYDDVVSTTVVDGVITAITMAGGSPTPQFYKYQVLRNTSDFVSTIKASIENGTVVHEQTLSLVFNKTEAVKTLQVQLLAQARMCAVAVDFNGRAFFFGRENGLDCSAGSMESGKKGEDLNGYKITLLASEPQAPLEIDVALLVAPNFQ